MSRNIEQIVERQAHKWHQEQQNREKAAQERPLLTPNVVTISNAFGSQATVVGHKVGEILNVPVYDRQILEHIATHAKVKVQTVETLDERALGAIDNYITSLFHQASFDQSDYLRELTKTITALWHHGPCVMIGHGSTRIVDKKHSLRVRITAPDAMRLARIQDLERLDKDAARKRMRAIDDERKRFHERCFGANVYDPMNYDLTLNCGTLGVTSCAHIVVEAYQRMFSAPTTDDLVQEELANRLSILPKSPG